MCNNLKMRSPKGMEKMIWLVISIVIMIMMVVIMALFFQSGMNKGGKTIKDFPDQSNWKSICFALCINLYMATSKYY